MIERTSFAGVTILLSLTVFLNMVAETMPATSDAVPLLGKPVNFRPFNRDRVKIFLRFTRWLITNRKKKVFQIFERRDGCKIKVWKNGILLGDDSADSVFSVSYGFSTCGFSLKIWIGARWGMKYTRTISLCPSFPRTFQRFFVRKLYLLVRLCP